MADILTVCAGVLAGIVASVVVAAVWIGVVEAIFGKGKNGYSYHKYARNGTWFEGRKWGMR
jgi:hypothetical protein